jgi:hypothetical protein
MQTMWYFKGTKERDDFVKAATAKGLQSFHAVINFTLAYGVRSGSSFDPSSKAGAQGAIALTDGFVYCADCMCYRCYLEFVLAR